MFRMKMLWRIFICLILPVCSGWAEYRSWEGRNGSRTEAELVKQMGSNVLLKKSDGKTIRVPIQKLSDHDQQYLKELQQKKSTPVQENAQSERIRQELEALVEKEKIPGMVAAIVSSDGILAFSSAGVRKDGTNKAVEINDLLHLGSNTKAMTSVLMATLVADNTLTWDTTLIEVFPSMKKEIHPDYHAVTVWQLLTHRSRIPNGANDWWAHRDLKLQKRRLAILEDNLEDPPKIAPGTYEYSNLGYMVAGCMAEKLTDETWETLIQERIFDPLGMSSAGFGPPGSEGKTDQPWGHNRKAGAWNPLQHDNPEALGPAGTVHCSIEDWAKFVALQLPGSNPLGLEQALLDQLITPIGTYAGGWQISKRSWGKGTVLSHAGSNTMWYAQVWVAPAIKRAFLVVTNSCDENSGSVCQQMIDKLIQIDQGN